MDMVETSIVEIHYATEGANQVLILQEKEGERSFPIFVGPHEAEMLLMALEKVTPPRPLTHDLVLNAIQSLGGTLTGIWINELQGGTYIGKLMVRTVDGDTVMIDSRPSDAVVLATKESVPIYVAGEVLEEVALTDEGDEDTDSDDDGEY